MSRRRSAFSLIELVIVVLVIGILAGVAAPRYSQALRWQRLEAASRQIAADLGRARDEAVRTSTRTRVEFFLGRNEYELHYVKDPAPMPAVEEDDRPGEFFLADPDRPSRPLRVHLSETGYSVQLFEVGFGDTDPPAVTFDVYGRPDNQGVITIIAGDESRVVDSRVVDVSATGQISIFDPEED